MGVSHCGRGGLCADVDMDDSMSLGRVSADKFGRWAVLGAAMATAAAAVARLVVDTAGALHHHAGDQPVLRLLLSIRNSGGAVAPSFLHSSSTRGCRTASQPTDSSPSWTSIPRCST